jgi:hypothetical protein
MKMNDLADDVQEQLLSVVEIAQANIVAVLEAVAEQAQHLIPHYARRFADRLPSVPAAVDRGFERSEQWLRVQRQFAAKVGDTFSVSA